VSAVTHPAADRAGHGIDTGRSTTVSVCSTCSSSSSDDDDYPYHLPPRRQYGGVRISYVPNDAVALAAARSQQQQQQQRNGTLPPHMKGDKYQNCIISWKKKHNQICNKLIFFGNLSNLSVAALQSHSRHKSSLWCLTRTMKHNELFFILHTKPLSFHHFLPFLSLIVVLELPILNNKLIDMSTDGVRVRVFSFCVVEYLLVSCDLSYYNLLRWYIYIVEIYLISTSISIFQFSILFHDCH